LDRACAATTREALVEALAPAERSAGEVSLGAPELLSLLGSSPAGLSPQEPDAFVGRLRGRLGRAA
jgi:hypothetical protein